MAVVNDAVASPSESSVAAPELLRRGPYVFKRAQSADELEQVHRLNHRTFVHEIAQHPDPGTGALVDKFHDKNRYFVALRQGRVVGMVAAHDRPPFSVAERLADAAVLAQLGPRLLEVRLLAIEPEERHGIVFAGLMWLLYGEALQAGHSHVVISGVLDRRALYERIGFRALGPGVRSGAAEFIPMALALAELPEGIQHDLRRWGRRVDSARAVPPPAAVSLLPGPVEIADAVRDAFRARPVSHRAPEFIDTFERVRAALGQLTCGMRVALLNGGGTLANDVVAAVLAARRQPGRGLVLSNGEFGDRLARQAARTGLEHRRLAWRWGEPWELERIDDILREDPGITWVWGVHLESSTGMLNELAGLAGMARAHGVRLCVDSVSSLGAVPLDHEGLYLASGVSGKALGGYAGIAIVFASPAVPDEVDAGRLPASFDLPAALGEAGPRFTFPSPLLWALERALVDYASAAARQQRFEHYAGMGSFVRDRLRSLGIEPLAAERWAAPTITTFALPGLESVEDFLEQCRAWGFEIAGRSAYLRARRLVQLATMGAVTRDHGAAFFRCLRRWLHEPLGRGTEP